MLEILRIQDRSDKNGKRFKTFHMEHIDQKNKLKNKYATINVYGMDYLDNLNPLYLLDEGDKVVGEVVTLNIEPVLVNTELLTWAAVCVLSEDFDPIQREIEVVKAFKRDGYTIAKGQLKFGEEEVELQVGSTVPKNCLQISI